MTWVYFIQHGPADGHIEIGTTAGLGSHIGHRWCAARAAQEKR